MTGGGSNLRPAPLHLTSQVTAKLVGDRPAYGKGVARLPVQGKLVDRPRASANPANVERNRPDSLEVRRRLLDGATAHLKRLCILVDPVDRFAAIRQYRVSGRRYRMLAEDVIAFAVDLGFEPEDPARG